MKITKTHLRKIIKEEVVRVCREYTLLAEGHGIPADRWDDRSDTNYARETWVGDDKVLTVLAQYLFGEGFHVHPAMEEFHVIEGFKDFTEDLKDGLGSDQMKATIKDISELFGEVTIEDVKEAIESLEGEERERDEIDDIADQFGLDPEDPRRQMGRDSSY